MINSCDDEKNIKIELAKYLRFPSWPLLVFAVGYGSISILTLGAEILTMRQMVHKNLAENKV